MPISNYPVNAPGILKTSWDASATEFPVIVDFIELNRVIMQARWYKEVECLLITEGTVNLIAGEKTYTLEAGSAAVLAPGLIHMSTPADEKKRTLFYRVLFDPEFLFNYDEPYLMLKYCNPLLNSPDFKVHLFHNDQPEDATVMDFLNRVVDINLSPDFGYELQTRSYLTHIWMMLIKRIGFQATRPPKRSTQNVDNARMKGAMSYIQEHYTDPLTLEEIADSVHISKSECCRCFKRTLNLTPFEYLMKYRIFVACKYIVDNPDLKSFSDLGYSVGFNYSSYFNKIFKKYMNCTPSEYRRRVREGQEV